MLQTNITKHVPLPKDTPAFFCGNCGAVALDPRNICRPQGKGKKIDWCGSKSEKPRNYCFNGVNNERHICKKCGQVSVNDKLLCEPAQMEKPPKR